MSAAPDDRDKLLQKIAEIELDGERYDLAKNGQFTLVKPSGVDAYGRPIAVSVDLAQWSLVRGAGIYVPRIQALLDALGDATVRLQAQRDARLASRTETGSGET